LRLYSLLSGSISSFSPATANPDETFTYSDIVFDASASYDPDNISHIVSYEWDFDGDGVGDASGETVTHNFTDGTEDYTVTLTVTDNYGASNSTSVEVRVKNRAPNASIIGPGVTSEGVTVEFIANASDMDGEIVGYEWDFGDGDTGTGEKVEHVYSVPEEMEEIKYIVNLTVIDDDGATATATHELRVIKNLPPVASFTVSNETPETNQRVEFDASSSYDPDGSIVAYRWDFDGDGVWDIEGNVVTITHSYNKSGNYTVKLEVEDDVGATDWTTKEINVSVVGPGKGISGNVTWNGKHTIEGLGRRKIIGVSRHIKATAQEIKNTLNSTVNVTVELRVDGLLLNSTMESLEPQEQKDITVSATWVPMSSGMHNVSLHAYDGPYWVGPTNDPGIGVEVFIEKVKS